jgi:hypothetical protein
MSSAQTCSISLVLCRSWSVHPGGTQGQILGQISHRCLPMLVAFVWESTKETINLPPGCLLGGCCPTAFLGPITRRGARKLNIDNTQLRPHPCDLVA